MAKINWVRFAPSMNFAKKNVKKVLAKEFSNCKITSLTVKRNLQGKYKVPHISGWKPYTIKAIVKCERK